MENYLFIYIRMMEGDIKHG